jgi:ribosomal biogenesis protein LAS1
MAYCCKRMTPSVIFTRLVNGFMENAHKKTGLSISELAEAVGIPRVLVDIRHG